MGADHVDSFIKKHGLEEHEGDLFDAFYEDGWDTEDAIQDYQETINAHEIKIIELNSLLNSPEIENFLPGVQLEAGHQRWRWGDEHDMRKTAGEWFWALGFLAQKVMIAAENGDIKKAKHHTISSAALLANWHRHICRCQPVAKNDGATAQKRRADD